MLFLWYQPPLTTRGGPQRIPRQVVRERVRPMLIDEDDEALAIALIAMAEMDYQWQII